MSGESSEDRVGRDGRAVLDMRDIRGLHLEAQAAHARDVSLDELTALLVRLRPIRLQEAVVPRRLGLRTRAAPIACISTPFTLIPRKNVHTASGPSG